MERSYSIEEFIQKTKDEPLNWINYCEILLTRNGRVLIASPCHADCAVNYIMHKKKKSRQGIMDEVPDTCLPLEWIVDKYGLCAIWFSGYMFSSYHGKSDEQERSIQLLTDNNLITKENPYIDAAYEYKNYLYRKSLGIKE